MGLFCLLWIPIFYLFRRSVTGDGGGGYIWAILLGSAAVLMHLFFGSLFEPGGFGFSRWAFGFVEIVSIPVFIPLAVYWLLVSLRALPASVSQENFALLWLIPQGAFRSVNWISDGNPQVLVLVPVLWAAQAVGMPFFINYILRGSRWYVIAVSVFCATALPLIASSCWWAFFSHQAFIGLLLLCASLVPAIISLIMDYNR